MILKDQVQDTGDIKEKIKKPKNVTILYRKIARSFMFTFKIIIMMKKGVDF